MAKGKPGTKIRLCFQPGCRMRIKADVRFCEKHATEVSRQTEKGRRRVCFQAGCKTEAVAGTYFCASHSKIAASA